MREATKNANFYRMEHEDQTRRIEEKFISGSEKKTRLPDWYEYHRDPELDYVPIMGSLDEQPDRLPDRNTWEVSQNRTREAQLKAIAKYAPYLKRVKSTRAWVTKNRSGISEEKKEAMEDLVQDQGRDLIDLVHALYDQICILSNQQYLDISQAHGGMFTAEQWQLWYEQAERLEIYERSARQQLEDLGNVYQEIAAIVKMMRDDMGASHKLIKYSFDKEADNLETIRNMCQLWENPRPRNLFFPRLVPMDQCMIPERPQSPPQPAPEEIKPGKKRKREESGRGPHKKRKSVIPEACTIS